MISLALAVFALALFFLVQESRAWRATLTQRDMKTGNGHEATLDDAPPTREEIIALGDAALSEHTRHLQTLEGARLQEVEEAAVSERVTNGGRPFYPADIMPAWEDQDEREAMDEDRDTVKRTAERKRFLSNRG